MLPIVRPFGIDLKTAIVSLVLATLLIVSAPAADAQTFQVLHSFTGGSDGKTPYTGLTIDPSGNLYGTTAFGGFTGDDCEAGGPGGCGVIFKLARGGSGWVFHPLYQFRGWPSGDGAMPFGRVIIGPGGVVYGTAAYGGLLAGCGEHYNEPGCGTVFKLTPPPNICTSFSCPWNETQVYAFSGPDGAFPMGELTFDGNGNLYGATVSGGPPDAGGGTAYKLTPAGELTTLYSFCSEPICADGANPTNGVQLDPSGNVYGTTEDGGESEDGTAFQLAPSGSGWTLNTIYNFSGLGAGQYALTGLIVDHMGNLYGGTSDGSPNPFVFEFSPSNGSWIYNTLYTFTYQSCCGVGADLVMDSAGNLYGTTKGDSEEQVYGTVFKLTPSNGGWVYSDLHDFSGGSDGAYPYSSIVLDSSGNLYGTASEGGAYGHGVVWEITP
jgi:uncharacterized repeat protein (TIGR03803 family)